jgi:hypothetical protein
MFTWHRVFARLEKEPSPAEVCEELGRHSIKVRPTFRGDDHGWFAGHLKLEGRAASLHVERYLVRAEKLRSEINTWSAWVESLPEAANKERVLDALVATAQLFTLHEEEDSEGEAASPACMILCRWLARLCQGIYQVDGLGVFDERGKPLLAEQDGQADA